MQGILKWYLLIRTGVIEFRYSRHVGFKIEKSKADTLKFEEIINSFSIYVRFSTSVMF
jgi:hypothetical protein